MEVISSFSTSKNGFHMRFRQECVDTLLAEEYKDPTILYMKVGGGRTISGKEQFGPLMASSGQKCFLTNQEALSGDYFVNDESYIIRRLTPTECARLQGFPDWWCDNLASEPTDEEVDEWMEIFNTHSIVVNGKPTSKSRNQVIKWLRDPHSDSAEYKMWGNGVALPCVDYIMAGIAYWSQQEIEEKQDVRQMTIEEWLKEENQ